MHVKSLVSKDVHQSRLYFDLNEFISESYPERRKTYANKYKFSTKERKQKVIINFNVKSTTTCLLFIVCI